MQLSTFMADIYFVKLFSTYLLFAAFITIMYTHMDYLWARDIEEYII